MGAIVESGPRVAELTVEHPSVLTPSVGAERFVPSHAASPTENRVARRVSEHRVWVRPRVGIRIRTSPPPHRELAVATDPSGAAGHR
jgi:hypothetical protein